MIRINTLSTLLQEQAAIHGNTNCSIEIWDKDGGDDPTSMCAGDDLPLCDADVINNLDGPEKILAIDFFGHINRAV